MDLEQPAEDSSAKPAGWSLDVLQSMEWKRWELVTAAYYRLRGYRAETLDHGPDGGVDVRLFEPGCQAPFALVQCKAWTERVGVSQMREHAGVMAHEKVQRGIFVGKSGFTPEAKEFAQANRIECISAEVLLQKIAGLAPSAQQEMLEVATEGDWTTPSCASCGAKMTIQTRRRDSAQVWRCAACWPRRNRTEYVVADRHEALTLEDMEEPAETEPKRGHFSPALTSGLTYIVLTVVTLAIIGQALQTVVKNLTTPPASAKASTALPVPQRPAPTAAPAPMRITPATAQDTAAEERQVAAEELKRKDVAFQVYFHRSDQCAIEANQTTVACVNEYIRARREFDQRWSDARR